MNVSDKLTIALSSSLIFCSDSLMMQIFEALIHAFHFNFHGSPPILQLEEIEHGREGIERVIEEQKRNGENHEPIGQSQGGAETEKSAKDDHS